MSKPKAAASDPEPAPMPPEGQENKDPNEAAAQAAEDVKSEDQKRIEAAVTGSNTVGGQGGGPGSAEITRLSATDKTMTPEELADSTHPLAPTAPLVDPLADKKE